MVERGAGAILNVGSIAGCQPIPGNATYAATKAFVNSFSEALHAELRGTGVSCTVVTPGPGAHRVRRGRRGPTDLERRAPGFVCEAPRRSRARGRGMGAAGAPSSPGPRQGLATGGRYGPRVGPAAA